MASDFGSLHQKKPNITDFQR